MVTSRKAAIAMRCGRTCCEKLIFFIYRNLTPQNKKFNRVIQDVWELYKMQNAGIVRHSKCISENKF